MGLNESMTGYKKLKNKKGYTTEDLLSLMKSVTFSFGTPKIGVIAKKEAIVFEGIGDFTAYIYVNPDAIEIGRGLVGKGSGKRLLMDLAASFLSNASAKDTAVADRAVEELFDVLTQLLKTGVMENKSGTVSVATLYMNQKILSITDQFDIFDEDQKPVYHVAGNLISHHYKIEDVSGNLVMEIKKKMFAVMPEYIILKDEEEIGSLKKKFTMTRPVITGELNHKQLEMSGNLSGYHFGIKLDEVTIGAVDTARLTWGDVYSIDIRDKSQQELVVAVSIIADNLLKSKD